MNAVHLLPALIATTLMSACSSEPAATPAARPSATASPRPTPAASRTTISDDRVRPAPGDLKTFADWTVGCDNVRRCAMASLGPDGGDFPPVTLEVARDAGADGEVFVRVLAGQEEVTAAALDVDGRRFGLDRNALAGTSARAAAVAMAKGRAIAVVTKDGVRHALSPAGASAALRYIDAGQGRADTSTALVATGAKPAAAIPAAAPLPVVLAVASGSATRPTAAHLATMRKLGACEERMTDASIWKPRSQGYADGATLVLLPCSAGAYNEIDALFVIRDGHVAAARVDAPSGFEATGADPQTPVRSVINGEFDRGALTSYAKGRGLGDCGSAQRFAWDGTQLRLTEQTAMGECRGNPNYLTVWRARAVAK